MFNQDVAAICAGDTTQNGSAVAARLPASAMRTIGARDVAFPLRDPFSPAIKARVPVSGLNAWPQRGRLGRRYYGLGDGPDPFSDEGGGFTPASGGLPVGSEAIRNQGVRLPGAGGNILEDILNTIRVTLPATISALKKQPYYNPAQGLQTQQQTIAGQTIQTTGPGSAANVGATLGASAANTFNSLANFVATNPLLVLGGGAALFLLFREPPRRR